MLNELSFLTSLCQRLEIPFDRNAPTTTTVESIYEAIDRLKIAARVSNRAETPEPPIPAENPTLPGVEPGVSAEPASTRRRRTMEKVGDEPVGES